MVLTGTGAKRRLFTLLFCLLVLPRLMPQEPHRSGRTDRLDFREEMRRLVIAIANRARQAGTPFFIIPQNGEELLTKDGNPEGPIERPYLQAIDAVGREELFFGYSGDDRATPASIRAHWLGLCDIARKAGKAVLITDYCHTPARITAAYRRGAARNYTTFAAPRRELDTIPQIPFLPYRQNSRSITSPQEAANFLYLINPARWESGRFPSGHEAFLNALADTDYDLLIIDPYFNDDPLNREDLETLKRKASGGRRLVIAYMSIGEAESYRYYWKPSWISRPPSWLEEENPNWKGNFKVRYWDPAWQEIIFRGEDAYLQRIQEAGFDGVYLDLIDAYEYFEAGK